MNIVTFFSFYQSVNLDQADDTIRFTTETSYGETEMIFERRNLKWVWVGVENTTLVNVARVASEVADRPIQSDFGQAEVFENEGNLLVGYDLQITLDSYEIVEEIDAIPNSFFSALPDRPDTRYLVVEAQVEYFGEGVENLLNLTVVDNQGDIFELFSGNVPVENDLSSETLRAKCASVG
jgi:hypothetical protein